MKMKKILMVGIIMVMTAPTVGVLAAGFSDAWLGSGSNRALISGTLNLVSSRQQAAATTNKKQGPGSASVSLQCYDNQNTYHYLGGNYGATTAKKTSGHPYAIEYQSYHSTSKLNTSHILKVRK